VRNLDDGGQLLTPRQIAVLQLAAYGLSGGQIARRLGISVRTVHDHFNRMRERTGTRTGSELIAQAVAEGLVKPHSQAPAQIVGRSIFAADARTRRIGFVSIGADVRERALEHDAIAVAGCDQIVEEKADARNAEGCGLATAMSGLKAGDILVVWKIERLGNSVEEVLNVIARLGELGAAVTIVDGDLSGYYKPDDDGEIFFTMAAVLSGLRENPR
jgi:DNA-binding CsgD family transcriptional regulator